MWRLLKVLRSPCLKVFLLLALPVLRLPGTPILTTTSVDVSAHSTKQHRGRVMACCPTLPFTVGTLGTLRLHITPGPFFPPMTVSRLKERMCMSEHAPMYWLPYTLDYSWRETAAVHATVNSKQGSSFTC